MVTKEEVLKVLSAVEDPEIRRSLVELGMVRNLKIEGGHVAVDLALTTLACPLKDQIVARAREAVFALDGVTAVDVGVVEMSDGEVAEIVGDAKEQGLATHLNRIGNVIAVMSGKGGVGKSLVAGLLAVALKGEGLSVGILDADITGPSIPKMFFPDQPRLTGSPLGVLPVRTGLGIEIMSMNLLLPHQDDPVIWRGPLLGKAIQQFWEEIIWGSLDYLVVDLPPGTSDASLTVMQSFPLEGVILVTSPQDLAGMVVKKAAKMARHMKVPILGLLENMSYVICPDTGRKLEVFGPSHAQEMAREIAVPLLGRLPIDPDITRLCDAGRIEEYQTDILAPVAKQLASRVLSTEMSPDG
jgi:Mrp family chromosome partitioning ATPase